MNQVGTSLRKLVMTTAALIVAAGRGHRVSEDLPKQYLLFRGKALLYHAAHAFLAHPDIDRMLVMINPDDRPHYDEAMTGLALPPPCAGGMTRQETVRLGLEHLNKDGPPDRVLIHDAARPFISADLISAILNSLNDGAGAVPVIPIIDSVKEIDGDTVTGTVDRTTLGRAQTPQGFHFASILDAHRQFKNRHITDDAEVAALAGIVVNAVQGDPSNIKITSPEDIVRLRELEYAGRETRTGIGFDVHRLGDGDHVILGGIRIKHNKALVGHSDADVALHALTDALLGAVSAGDIGQHFPPEDDRWKDAPSDLFLRHAVSQVQSVGGDIVNVDLTIICEAPKIGPHSDAMRASIARIIGLDVDRVSIKATTTERLGTTGDGAGIAAQAIATVALPARRD